MGETTTRGTESFDFEDHHGEVVPDPRPTDLRATVSALVNPTAANDTLHWGRNYLYGAEIETAGAAVPVVVKQFRNQGPKRRMERRYKGSKAWRSWRIALAMKEAGIATPEPLLWIESRDLEGPSFFVSRRLDDFLETRYFFRALEAGREKSEYPRLDATRVVERIGSSIRRLHDTGIWHRDMSIGNVLLVGEDGQGPREVFFIDLNRARLRSRLTTLQRTRDLARLRIFRRDLQGSFLRSYWGSDVSGFGRRRLLLYSLLFNGFLLKVKLKNAIRRPFRGLRDMLSPRHPHVHIPQAPDEASKRDRAVWDGLSDQPHQHATRFQRLAVRIGDAPLHCREIVAAAGALPRVRRRYKELKSRLYDRAVEWPGMGIAVRPWPANPDALMTALEKLGTRQVLLRLHAWQESHGHEEELARELHRKGYDLVFVLAQNRDLVREPARWREVVGELADRFGEFGNHFQIGQAINRSKWGIWNYTEYLELAAVAAEVLRQTPGRTLLGPAVIDYEPMRTAGILNIQQQDVFFEILASLLYVDRRGAPENTQLGFDTVDKVIQLKAIADTSPSCGDRSWITEVNWPLWEGPHSPAGRKVSVNERKQADYLVRYYLLALGTGLVERVYWWQLVAKGYGLSHDAGDGDLRYRKSLAAFATLRRILEGATFLGPVKTAPRVRLYRFRSAEGGDLIAGWSTDNSSAKAELPAPAYRAMRLDGQEMAASGTQVEIDGSPRYFWMETG